MDSDRPPAVDLPPPATERGTTDAERARERDRRHVWHTWSPISADRAQLLVSHASGYRLWDADGREYIDACSLNATCGYGHPHVIRAIMAQAERIHGFDMSQASHELAGRLAERISSHLSPSLAKTLFVNSGSEGFEAAMLIAAGYWSHSGQQRTRVVAFARGYHGSTLLSRSMSTLPRVRHPFRAPMPVTFVGLPTSTAETRLPNTLPKLVAAFEAAIGADPADPPMAVVVEPFLNVGGGVVLPPGFLPALRRLCDATGTLLVLDEVFTGYGRTGSMFACQLEGVLPDILVSSKGLGSGYVPIAAVTVSRHIHDSFANDPVIGGLRYGHTTSGHALGCAAALATLDVIEREGLLQRTSELGAALVGKLGPLAGACGVIDVRGLGLIAVLDLASVDAATRLRARAREHGLLLRQQGQALMAVPPLTIDERGVDGIADRVASAVQASA
jgi:adenosylmethionine-8-amino-7-oxononanoate aminotransferase